MNAYELAKQINEDTCIQIGSIKPKELANVIVQMADQIAELKNARDYWCLQYKDVINKLDNKF